MTLQDRLLTTDTAAPRIEIRPATMADRPALEALKEAALRRLLDPHLTEPQRRTMRLIAPFDPRLVDDGTYYVATIGGWIAASGGWSRRAALYRGPEGVSGADRLLDPARDAASVRAMYTHPDVARRGLGRLVLETALVAARVAGFRRARLLATPAGERLYRAAGWCPEERLLVGPTGRPGVPGVTMSKDL